MNNNRGGNNRRRGRGNNNGIRPQGANGGQQVNRIDSRARGNAPQMHEKYRKLANDAHLIGDRVNAEYYLQFADHYFRVIADTRVRQEEQRLRRDDRWQEGDGDREESEDSADFGADSEFAAFDQPPVYTRREREDRPERPERSERQERPERTPERVSSDRGQERPQAQSDSRRRDERPAHDQQANGRNDDLNQRQSGADEQAPLGPGSAVDHDGKSPVGESGGETVTAYEPPENPFLRENRGGRGLRPRREDRRPRREDRPEGAVPGENQDTDRATRAISAGIDPQTLPPSFTVARDEPPIVAKAAAPEPVAAPATIVEEGLAEKPAPRRRAKRKPVADDTDGSIQSLI